MTEDERHSIPAEAVLASDPDEIARLEARNALRQFDTMIELVDSWLARPERPFRLRPSAVLDLHRVALDGISRFAGTWRTGGVTIGQSRHEPPGPHLVPALVEEMCDYVNENWAAKSSLHLAAFIMWKLNWIHPFEDGNGRTSRAVSYLVLCVRLGYKLPGVQTIPELIASAKVPYYEALEKADDGDLAPLEQLLSAHLATQLLAVVTSAGSAAPAPTSEDGPKLH